MRLRTRWLVVLALFGLFALAPATDAPDDHAYLARLRVREWLLGEKSPLSAWWSEGTVPALAVELRRSPPLEDSDAQRRQEAEHARCVVEWAAARSADRQPTRVDASRGSVPLRVVVGRDGLRADLPQPAGPPQVLILPFANRTSLLPAFVAIGLAVLTQRVLLALFAGCLAGAIAYVLGALPGQPLAALQALDLTTPLSAWSAAAAGLYHFLVDALWSRSVLEAFHLRITLFVVFLFMTVGVITRNGGLHGLVHVLQRRVRGPVSAQLCSFFAGLVVFFDDYTNCLLVGSSMRPLCDASRVSREKLAWIVDSTAAPIAGLSVFSTWVTYEMSQYRAPLALVTRPDGTPYASDDAFAVFLQTMPFRCYCLFTLAMVALVILMRRDFGPMLAAERRARRAGASSPAPATAEASTGLSDRPRPGVPPRARNAVLPLLVLVLGTVLGMVGLGWSAAAALPAGADGPERVRTLLANSQSDVALLGASIAAWLLALAQTAGQRLLPWRETLQACWAATRTLWVALAILFMAWSLGCLCQDLGTSFYLTAAAREAMTAIALPVLLFVIASAIAFATGTSFGTMAILLPNVVVLAHQVGSDAAFTGSAAAGGPALMLLCIGAVLEGAIFGDHCSPISDTTVLSSLGAGCDLLAHVQTQLPYALLGFATSVTCGYLPLVCFGPDSWPWCLLAGVAVLALVLRLFGRDAGRAA